jgi:hypothetical protein
MRALTKFVWLLTSGGPVVEHLYQSASSQLPKPPGKPHAELQSVESYTKTTTLTF